MHAFCISWSGSLTQGIHRFSFSREFQIVFQNDCISSHFHHQLWKFVFPTFLPTFVIIDLFHNHSSGCVWTFTSWSWCWRLKGAKSANWTEKVSWDRKMRQCLSTEGPQAPRAEQITLKRTLSSLYKRDSWERKREVTTGSNSHPELPLPALREEQHRPLSPTAPPHRHSCTVL